MRIAIKPSSRRPLSLKAYAVRFAFGGTVTAGAGLVAALAGPDVGGIFLAFPSIAVASLTLLERHEGKNAVGADAWGTSLGSLSMIAFAAVVWSYATRLAAWATLLAAFGAWFACACALWRVGVWARHLRCTAHDRARHRRNRAIPASYADHSSSARDSA